MPRPIENIRSALRLAMAARNLRGKALSRRAGLSESAVRDLLGKIEDPRLGTLIALAKALDISPTRLVGETLPVSGSIGGGGEILLDANVGLAGQMVPFPPSFSTKIMALKVDGDHLFPAYRDGDIIYLSRQHDGALTDYLGEECAIKIHPVHGGKTVLRSLAKGSEPDRYALRCHSAPDIEDVAIEWIAPVIFVMRARYIGIPQSAEFPKASEKTAALGGFPGLTAGA
jgi:phage repressor protein C with HTH and peptisase S24 domain